MLNVKKYREALGISQREAAMQLGITPQRYNNYETGIRECTDGDARRSAVAEKLEKLSDEQLDRLLAALESILNE